MKAFNCFRMSPKSLTHLYASLRTMAYLIWIICYKSLLLIFAFEFICLVMLPATVLHGRYTCSLQYMCRHGYILSIVYLIHWSRVTHICVSKQTIIGSDNGLAASHYLNQIWNIVNWNLRNKLRWNFNRNSKIFIQENGFECVVCEMAAILSRPQCVNCVLSQSYCNLSSIKLLIT